MIHSWVFLLNSQRIFFLPRLSEILIGQMATSKNMKGTSVTSLAESRGRQDDSFTIDMFLSIVYQASMDWSSTKKLSPYGRDESLVAESKTSHPINTSQVIKHLPSLKLEQLVGRTTSKLFHLSHEKEKNSYFPLNPGCLIGIHILVYDNPYNWVL